MSNGSFEHLQHVLWVWYNLNMILHFTLLLVGLIDVYSIQLYKQHMICFGCSKKSSQWDGSFEYPQHELLLGKRKHDFSSNTLIWISG